MYRGKHVSGMYLRGKNAPRIYFLCQKARSRTHVFVKISVYWEHPNDVFCLISFLTFFLKPGRRWLKQRSGHGGRQKARGGWILNNFHHYWDLLYFEPSPQQAKPAFMLILTCRWLQQLVTASPALTGPRLPPAWLSLRKRWQTIWCSWSKEEIG